MIFDRPPPDLVEETLEVSTSKSRTLADWITFSNSVRSTREPVIVLCIFLLGSSPLVEELIADLPTTEPEMPRAASVTPEETHRLQAREGSEGRLLLQLCKM